MRNNPQRGFTLIEMMIVIIVVGILAAVALPSYRSQVLKGNRAVAKAKLLDIAAKEEVYFGDNKVYQNSLSAFGIGADVTAGVDQNYNWVAPDDGEAIYEISVTLSNGGLDYTATADTVNNQSNDDDNCATLSITSSGLRSATGNLGSECWE